MQYVEKKPVSSNENTHKSLIMDIFMFSLI